MPGMRLSSTTTDGRRSAICAIPAGPACASSTSKPARVSARTKKRRTASSSSTSSTLSSPTRLLGIEHLADPLGQVDGAEGLGQEIDAGVELAVVHDGRLGIPRDVQHSQLGPARPESIRDLDASEVREHDVAHEQVDRSTAPVSDLQ